MISFTIVILVLASTLHKVSATSEPNFSASSTCAKDKEKCRSKVPCCPGLTCKGDWNTGKKCTSSTPGPTYRPCPGVNEKCRQRRCCKGLVCEGKWHEAKCVNPYPTPGPTYKPKKCAKKWGDCSNQKCCGDLECGNGNKCKEPTKNPPPVAQPSPKPFKPTKFCLKMNISCKSKKDKCCDWLTCSKGKCVMKQPDKRKIEKDERCGKNKIGKCRDGFQCCNKYKCGYDIWGKCTDKE